MCELIYAHSQHDMQLRIRVVQNLKKYLREDELVYCCQANLLQQETQFNEQWFDVFLYYALIGLSNQRVNIRVYAINMLCTIAKKNPEAMLEVAEKISSLADEQHWEIKTQCLEFAATLLSKFKEHAVLLAVKDDLKGAAGGAQKAQSPQGPNPSSGLSNGQKPTGQNQGPAVDKSQIKNSLQLCIEIIRKCFNISAPKSVQKLGLFKLQPLLKDYKLLYATYIEVLLQVDQEIKSIILSEEPIRSGEEIYFSLGLVSFNYKLRSDLADIDPILMCNSVIDYVISNGYESLEQEHMQLITVCAGANAELNGLMGESWLRVYQKLKDYLLVSICDQELCVESLAVLHNFLTHDQLKYQVQDETRDLMVKSIELLCNGDSDFCKDRFKEYLENSVLKGTGETDSALRKFFKNVLQRVCEEHSAAYASSNLIDIKEKL